MKDTSEKIQKLYHNLLMQKDGKARLMMGFSMFDSSLKIMKTSFSDNLSETKIKVKIFTKLYKKDLDSKTFAEIVRYLLGEK